MIKLDEDTLARMEEQYPGLRETIRFCDEAQLPACPQCRSGDTAVCTAGMVGRAIYLCAATTKVKLHLNGPYPGKHFCNACQRYFG